MNRQNCSQPSLKCNDGKIEEFANIVPQALEAYQTDGEVDNNSEYRRPFSTDIHDDPVKTVPEYERTIDKDNQIRPHGEVWTANHGKCDTDWRQQLFFNADYEDQRKIYEEMM